MILLDFIERNWTGLICFVWFPLLLTIIVVADCARPARTAKQKDSEEPRKDQA